MTTWSYRARGLLGVACGLCVAISSVASLGYLWLPAQSDNAPGTPVEVPESESERWAWLVGLGGQLAHQDGSPGLVVEPTETSNETEAELLGSKPLRGGVSGGADGDIVEPDVESPLDEPRTPSDASHTGKRAV